MRFGAYLICSSTSNEGLESYKAKHIELRKKYSTLELTKRIAEKRKDLNEIMLNIRPQLQRFIDMEHLPGQCELCSSSS